MVTKASKIPEESKPDIKPDLEGIRGQEGLNTNSAGSGRGGSTQGTGGRSAKMNYGDRDKQDSPSKLKDSEENGGEDPESGGDGDDDGQGGLWNDDASSSTTGGRRRFKLTRKKAAAGITGGFMLTATIFGTTSIIQGPMQLVHLSQVLQNNFTSSENSSSTRMKGLFRYYRSNDIGETRVTKLGSIVFKKTITGLEAVGWDFSDRNPLSGHLNSVTIDPSKHPATKDLPPSQRRAALAKHLGIKESDIGYRGSRLKIKVDPTSVRGIDYTNSLTGTAVGDLQDGKILTGMGTRSLKIFFNQSRLFSPISKRLKAFENRLAAKAVTRQEKKAAERARGEQRFKALRESPIGVKATAAKEQVKSALNANRVGLTAGLTFTGIACIVREVRDVGPQVDQAEVVIPSVLEASDKIAIGEKVKSGHDLAAEDLGQIVSSFQDDKGRSIWQSPALQATSGNENPGTPKLDDKEYQAEASHKQAFETKTYSKIEEVANSVGDVTCSTPSLILQGALSVALVFTGPGGWVVNGGKAAINAGTTAAVMGLLLSRYANNLEDKASLDLPLSGPLGGTLLAYGGREAANIEARASGGVALSDTESAALDRQQQEVSKREFESKSFASRMFDVYDHRSLAASVIDNTSLRPQSLTNVASLFSSLGSTFSGLFSRLLPEAHAASATYDWGFPKFGIPQSVLTDPNFEDPYENADRVGALLDSGRQDLIDKAKTCFGVEISKASGEWGVVAKEEVNANSKDYKKANCNDLGDANWKRTILFVFDSRLMAGAACYEGDNESCDELGANGTGGSSADTNTESSITADPDFKIKKLANPIPGSSCNCTIEPTGITLHWWGQEYDRGIQALVDIFHGNGLSVQIGITSDGDVYQMTKNLNTQANHAIGANTSTIGIEIEGGPNEFTKESIDKYPKKFAAVVATVKYLMDKYDIPATGEAKCGAVVGIHPHSAYNKCPKAAQKDDIDHAGAAGNSSYYFDEVMKKVRE